MLFKVWFLKFYLTYLLILTNFLHCILWKENTMIWKKKSKILGNCGWVYCVKTMETYFVGCKNNAVNTNSTVTGTKQNRLMLVLNSAFWGKKILRFIKSQEVSRLLSKLLIRTPLSK